MVNEQSKRHKRKILEYLDKYSPLGTSELSEFTGFHPETILILCNQLVKEGWILDKENKHGKYRLKKKSDFEFPSPLRFRHKLFSKFDILPLVTEKKWLY